MNNTESDSVMGNQAEMQISDSAVANQGEMKISISTIGGLISVEKPIPPEVKTAIGMWIGSPPEHGTNIAKPLNNPMSADEVMAEAEEDAKRVYELEHPGWHYDDGLDDPNFDIIVTGNRHHTFIDYPVASRTRSRMRAKNEALNYSKSPPTIVDVFMADALQANYDARKYPICAPHDGSKGLSFERFKRDFVTKIAGIEIKNPDEIYDLGGGAR